jgi:hypothetical protein
MGIVPSTVSVFGSITVTVCESWSALYTRSLPEIGCAPGSAGGSVTLACGLPATRVPDPLAGDAPRQDSNSRHGCDSGRAPPAQAAKSLNRGYRPLLSAAARRESPA